MEFEWDKDEGDVALSRLLEEQDHLLDKVMKALPPQYPYPLGGDAGGEIVSYTPASVTQAKTRALSASTGLVFGYARYSTPQQRASSIERQVESILAGAKAHGLTVAQIFVDRGITGMAYGIRDGLEEMIVACAANPGSIVLVEHMDRLSRDLPEYGRIKVAFNQSRTEIHDASGPNSPVMEVVKMGMAAQDRINMLDRTAMGRIKSALIGNWVSHMIPYGYRRTGPTKIDVDEKESANVVTIFELKALGLNYPQISEELRRLGIPAPRAKSGIWPEATLRRIVRNPVYVGWCVWHFTRPVGHS